MDESLHLLLICVIAAMLLLADDRVRVCGSRAGNLLRRGFLPGLTPTQTTVQTGLVDVCYFSV